jgi:hypothetical protein
MWWAGASMENAMRADHLLDRLLALATGHPLGAALAGAAAALVSWMLTQTRSMP